MPQSPEYRRVPSNLLPLEYIPILREHHGSWIQRSSCPGVDPVLLHPHSRQNPPRLIEPDLLPRHNPANSRFIRIVQSGSFIAIQDILF